MVMSKFPGTRTCTIRVPIFEAHFWELFTQSVWYGQLDFIRHEKLSAYLILLGKVHLESGRILKKFGWPLPEFPDPTEELKSLTQQQDSEIKQLAKREAIVEDSLRPCAPGELTDGCQEVLPPAPGPAPKKPRGRKKAP